VSWKLWVSEKQDVERLTWMVEGVQSSEFVTRAIVVPHTKQVPLKLINKDLTPLTLYIGTKLANAETVDEGNVSVAGSFDADSSNNTTVPVYMDNINLPDYVSQAQQDKLLALLSLCSDLTASSPNDLGHTHHIDMGDAQPIHQAACQVLVPCREKVEQLLENM